jgi:hypothetical protein
VNDSSFAGCQLYFEMRRIVVCKSCDVVIVEHAGGVLNTGRTASGGVGCKKGYIYSSSCDMIHILRYIGWLTLNNPAFILHNNQTPNEYSGSKQDLVLTVMTIREAGRCNCNTYSFCHSDVVHLAANWVGRKLSQLYKHPTQLKTPTGGIRTDNYGIE